MSYPHDPPFPAVEFDITDPSRFAALYMWAESAAKMSRWLEASGIKHSKSSIHNYRLRHNIPVADLAHRARDDQFAAETVQNGSSSDSVLALLEYLRDRDVPNPRETIRSVAPSGDYATALVASDAHYPFHHEGACGVVRQLLHRWQPDLLILNGDFQDFAALGKFAKNPSSLVDLQILLDNGRTYLAELAAAAPDARCIYIPGNHEEDRLLNYLWTHCSALASLRCLTLESMLGLSEIGWTYAPDGVELTDELVVIHGDRYSNMLGGGSGASARKEGLDLGVSSVTGHTHHGGVFYRQDRRSYRVNAEGFSLCDPEKMRKAGVTGRKRGGKPLDWHLGCIRVDYSLTTSRFGIMPIAIVESKGETFAIIDGEEVRA